MGGLTVRFWGTRGSIPTTGRKTEKYGGNTTCLELRHKDNIVILDAGSGIREMSEAWMRDPAATRFQATMLFTHLHWDHIQGFPFFVPAYRPGNSFAIYGENRPSGGIKELLSGQMGGDYFPVPLDAMRADLQFHATSDEFKVGRVKVKTFPLWHPGGALAYRLEVDSSVFILATDCELDQMARNTDELKGNRLAPREYSPEMLEFFRGANLVVIDCQFSDEEYENRIGWGHNGIAAVVDLCRQVTPSAVALFHHDPTHNDQSVARIVADTAQRLNMMKVHDMLVFAGREGLTMRVEKPLRPPLITSQ